jgi:hypothetical protein
MLESRGHLDSRKGGWGSLPSQGRHGHMVRPHLPPWLLPLPAYPQSSQYFQVTSSVLVTNPHSTDKETEAQN